MRRPTAAIWRWVIALGAVLGVLCVAAFLVTTAPRTNLPPVARSSRGAPRPLVPSPMVAPASVPDAPLVCVVGPDQRPLPGVEVTVEQGLGAGRQELRAVTDHGGEARFPGLRLGEARLLALRQPIAATIDELAPPYLDLTPPARTLRAQWTQVAAANLVGVHIELVDAESGEPLEHNGFEWRGGGQAGSVAPGHGPTRLHLPARAGELLSLDVVAAPMVGYVQWEHAHCVDRVSAYTRVMAIRVPLRRALPLYVQAHGPDGSPVADARISQLEFCGRIVNTPDCTIDSYGVIHTSALPALRGEPLVVYVFSERTRMSAKIHARVPDEPGAPLELDVALKRRGSIGVGGGAGGSFGDRCSYVTSVTPSVPPESAEYAEVHVEVLRHDGQPAVGANVYLAGQTRTTNDMGRVRFSDPYEGQNHVVVMQPGLLHIIHPVHVVTGEHVHLSVQESKGRRLEILVVDEQGQPLPYARFEAFSPWIDEVGGTQLADRYCDHEGRRSIARLSRDVRSFRVSWGTRKARVDVPPPGESSLRIVLAQPLRKP